MRINTIDPLEKISLISTGSQINQVSPVELGWTLVGPRAAGVAADRVDVEHHGEALVAGPGDELFHSLEFVRIVEGGQGRSPTHVDALVPPLAVGEAVVIVLHRRKDMYNLDYFITLVPDCFKSSYIRANH